MGSLAEKMGREGDMGVAFAFILVQDTRSEIHVIHFDTEVSNPLIPAAQNLPCPPQRFADGIAE